MFNCILIHYGELGLKGQNRPLFEKKLVENISKAVEGLEYQKLGKRQGRIILELSEKSDADKFADALGKVFGIAWFAFCFRTEATLENMEQTIADKFQLEADTLARVTAKRADKSLPFTSIELNQKLGTYIVQKFKVKISLSHPQKEIFVELFENKAYLFDKKFRGLFGLPVGVSGKVLHLLSGGIDSPVAAWLLMKRGCEVQFLHFHAFRKFEERKNIKIIELARVLAQYCLKTKVFFVPFYPFEAEAVEAPVRYRLILFRRFMIRAAEELAVKYCVLALGSGESLAQVSSQTLENMATIDRASLLPILRPLLTYEKNEIVELAKKIGTFNISVKPYKDCCSLFVAKHPATKARREIVEEIEKKLSITEAVKESLEKTEIVNIG